MDKLKNFLKKKRLDKQFSKAGTGRSIGEQHQPSMMGSSAETRSADPAAIAKAIERRLDQGKKSETRLQKKIRLQAKKELEQERQQNQAQNALAEELASSSLEDLNSRQTCPDNQHPLVENGSSSILFTCELFDSDIALPKALIMEAIEDALKSLYEEEPIEAAIHMIFSLNKESVRIPAIETIEKYLNNIIENPDDPKFRRIRTSNKIFQTKVNPAKGSFEFLKSVGFTQETEIPKETNGAEEFLVLLDSKDISKIKSGLTSLKDGRPVSLKLFRDPKIFRIDAKKSIPNPNIPPEFFERTSQEIKKEQQALSNTVENLTTLRTSAMRANKSKKTPYKYAFIRVRFPNNFVLQGIFNVNEHLSSVRTFVSENIHNPCGIFSLTSSGCKLDNDDVSLAEHGLIPSALLYFDWDEETKAQMQGTGYGLTYLKRELENLADRL